MVDKERKEDPRLAAWKTRISHVVYDWIDKSTSKISFTVQGKPVTTKAISNYVSPFEWRYVDPVINTIFSNAATYQLLLDAEGAMAQSQADVGMIPHQDADRIASLTLDDAPPEKVWYIEETDTLHDVNALIKSIQEGLQAKFGEQSKFIHYGATSFDVRDNAELKQAKWATLRIRELASDFAIKIQDFTKNLYEKGAFVEKDKEGKEIYLQDPIIAGRTHGQYALPIPLSHRFVTKYLKPMVDQIEQLDAFIPQIKGKGIKGAVGTAASFVRIVEKDIEHNTEKLESYRSNLLEHQKLFTPQQLEDIQKADRHQIAIFTYQAMEKLFEGRFGLESEPITCQTTNRITYAELGHRLKMLCVPVAQLADDLWLSQMLGLMYEKRSKAGSSAMPQKRNPQDSENILGSNLFFTEIGGAYINSLTHFERHLSDSAFNRIYVPLMYQLCGHILSRGAKIVGNMEVSAKGIKADLDQGRRMMAGEAMKYELVATGYTSLDAHKLVSDSYNLPKEEVMQKGIGSLSWQDINTITTDMENYIGISPVVVKDQLGLLGSRLVKISTFIY